MGDAASISSEEGEGEGEGEGGGEGRGEFLARTRRDKGVRAGVRYSTSPTCGGTSKSTTHLA